MARVGQNGESSLVISNRLLLGSVDFNVSGSGQRLRTQFTTEDDRSHIDTVLCSGRNVLGDQERSHLAWDLRHDGGKAFGQPLGGL